jgi:hypothetical protein
VPALDGFGRMVAIRKQRWLKGRKTVSIRVLTFGVVNPFYGTGLSFGWGLFLFTVTWLGSPLMAVQSLYHEREQGGLGRRPSQARVFAAGSDGA